MWRATNSSNSGEEDAGQARRGQNDGRRDERRRDPESLRNRSGQGVSNRHRDRGDQIVVRSDPRKHRRGNQLLHGGLPDLVQKRQTREGDDTGEPDDDGWEGNREGQERERRWHQREICRDQWSRWHQPQCDDAAGHQAGSEAGRNQTPSGWSPQLARCYERAEDVEGGERESPYRVDAKIHPVPRPDGKFVPPEGEISEK